MHEPLRLVIAGEGTKVPFMMSAPFESLIASLPHFRDVAPEALRILAGAPTRRFRSGAVLWTAGSEARGFVIVLSGRVRVVGTRDGQQYAIHSESAGGTLGDVPFFAGGEYPATAIADEPTVCLMVDRKILARAIAADSTLALALLATLAQRVRTLVYRLDAQQTMTVDQRLAALLLQRNAESEGAPFALAITQADAAEEIGTVREVLVRTLRRFREAGLVTTAARGQYRILQRERLEQLAAKTRSK